jgi:hypothetical protein
MDILWRLILSHFIADFSLQTNRVATWKRESGWGMAVHTLTHPLVTYILVWPYLSWPWVQTRWFSVNGWMCVALVTVGHWLQDNWRVTAIQHTGAADSTGFFLWDQVVHLVIILAVSPTAAIAPVQWWVIPALCFVLLSHFISVLIFFLENDLKEPSDVLEGWKKYRYIFERLIGAALFLLPGPWFLLGFIWIGWVVFMYYRYSHERTWVHTLVGNASIVILGFIARGFLF